MVPYTKGKRIAFSYTADVYEGSCEGKSVIVKVYFKTPSSQKLSLLERISRLSHPNLLTPLHVFIDNDKLVEISDYVAWDILDEQKNLSLDQTKRIITDVLKALSVLHAQGIVHHDVAERNIFVEPVTCSAKLFDFSCATEPYYLEKSRDSWNDVPPEYHTGKCIIDYRFDVYQLGILLKEITHVWDYQKNASVPKLPLPQSIIDMITKSTHPDKEKRYLSAHPMLEELLKL